MAEENVVLVDGNDVEHGVAPKGQVHRTGERHRAVSVFLFDASGRTLLQRRAEAKYHSPGLWSNTCCGHPRPGERALDAAQRRLREEMGIECALTHVTTFEYRAEVGDGLLEHEVDHVFRGTFTGTPSPDADEVSDFRWELLESVRQDCVAHPERYSAWLPLALARLRRHLSA